jgi:hypothetical protein
VLAMLEGVRQCASGYVARCPAHDDRTASLSIREGEGGRVLLHCFAGCSFRAIHLVLERLRLPVSGTPASTPMPIPRALDDRRRTEYAGRIWHQTIPITGTLAEDYLRSRGITMPLPGVLRFHPALKHPSGQYIRAAMVAAVLDADGNRRRTGTGRRQA